MCYKNFKFLFLIFIQILFLGFVYAFKHSINPKGFFNSAHFEKASSDNLGNTNNQKQNEITINKNYRSKHRIVSYNRKRKPFRPKKTAKLTKHGKPKSTKIVTPVRENITVAKTLPKANSTIINEPIKKIMSNENVVNNNVVVAQNNKLISQESQNLSRDNFDDNMENVKNYLSVKFEKIKKRLKTLKTFDERHESYNKLMTQINDQVSNLNFENVVQKIHEKMELFIEGVKNRLGIIEQKVSVLENVVRHDIMLAADRLQELENKIIQQMKEKLDVISNKLINADKIVQEKLTFAQKLGDRNKSIGRLAKQSIDDEIKIEVDRQLAALKEDKLRSFEKTMKKRKKEKRVQKLKAMLQEALMVNRQG